MVLAYDASSVTDLPRRAHPLLPIGDITAQSAGMSTLAKKPAKQQRPSSHSKKRVIRKAVPGNPFAGLEHVFGSMSFPPLKGKALKQHIRARILADHNT